MDAIAGSMRSYEFALGASAALSETAGDISNGQWHIRADELG